MATQTLSKLDSRELKAEVRKVFGRKIKKLRREGVLPANIYGKKIKSKAVQVALADFKKVFAEVEYVWALIKKHRNWIVVDTTNKSIEETAWEIVHHVVGAEHDEYY